MYYLLDFGMIDLPTQYIVNNLRIYLKKMQLHQSQKLY